MQFKYPELLYFLFVLIIPILIHLFQLRKFKKIAFTNVQFLKNLDLQTRKSAKLKKYLVLLSRLFAFAFLILAFAQPFLSNKKETKEVNNLIYLDNSLSMQAKNSSNVSLFKQSIQQLVKNNTDKTSYSIITNDDSFVNLEGKAIKNELLSLETTATNQDFNSVLLKAKSHFFKTKETVNNVILVSDFQQKEPLVLDSTLNYHLVQLKPASTNNVSIDSVYVAKQTGKEITLNVVLQNHGTTKPNIAVSLFKDKILLGKASVEIVKNKEVTSFTFPFEDSFNGTVTIQDNNLSFDNTFYFSLNKTKKISVLAIGNDTNYLKRIYTPAEFDLVSSKLNSVDYTNIQDKNTIVLNELVTIPITLQKVLKTFVQNGGSLVVIPNSSLSVVNYNSFLTSLKMGTLTSLKTEELVVNQLHTSHEILKDVFEKKVTNFNYPFVKSYFNLKVKNASNIISLQNNIGFIQQKRIQKGKVYWFAGAINKTNSNLKSTSLIVPVFYNFAKQSFKVSNLFHTIGKTSRFEINTISEKDEVVKIVGENNSFIPLQKISANKVAITTDENPTKAGHFQVMKKESILSQLAYNYNRIESKTDFANLTNLENIKNVTITNDITQTLTNIEKDHSKTTLWKLFLLLGLAFLLVEMLLIRYLKNN